MTPATASSPPETPRNGRTGRLWTGAELAELEAAVCDAFTLNDLRQLARRKLDQELEQLVNPNAAKTIVVSDLIAELKNRGWVEVFVRAVYEERPKNPLVIAFCEARARFVHAPPPAAEEIGRSVISTLAEIQTVVGRPDAAPLRKLLHHLSSRFDESRRAIVPMRQY